MKKENQIEELKVEDQDIVDYYKKKNIRGADTLLFKTAQNNFKTGLDVGLKKAQEQIKKKDVVIDFYAEELKERSEQRKKDFEDIFKIIDNRIKELTILGNKEYVEEERVTFEDWERLNEEINSIISNLNLLKEEIKKIKDRK